ncbi:hypothetical protein HHI36_015602 [Cryptolaemus montrouzieri]|uniref:Uncharacterized protein n=1 Tax=Cryptolaemus montrouzieri TaxID=559131 RepID=A0ABD2N626_9CUCU
MTSHHPVVSLSITPRHYGPGCYMEISVLEKHDETCKFWQAPGNNEDSVGDYNTISRQVFKICDGIETAPIRMSKCSCEKATNTKDFHSCPICGQCPCHSRLPKVLSVPPTCLPSAYKTNDRDEDVNIPDFCKPLYEDDFVDSIGSRSSGSFSLPDFRVMQINEQAPGEKRSLSFMKWLNKYKRRNGEEPGQS